MTIVSATDFSRLPLPQAQLNHLSALGYRQMTPVQAQCLPLALAGKDLIGQAETGSGKTLAFALSILHKIDARKPLVQALVLCPTRELADQVAKTIRRLAQATPNVKLTLVCGGKPFGPQKLALQHGTHIVVGTPGRVLDHLKKSTLRLTNLESLVLDEADRMLDMGFLEAVSEIASFAPKNRQTLLFSATYPDEIQAISRKLQRDPTRISVESESVPVNIEELFYEVQKHERQKTLRALFEHYQPSAALVFCQTKKQCAIIAEFLCDNGIEATALHGDLEQRMRDQVLALFANRSVAVLVATDVAARGLDIESLPLVINYELPRDGESYVHRIGRTGRAGASGTALSLFTTAEQHRLRQIEDYLDQPCICDVPASLDPAPQFELRGTMNTIRIDAGRKNKLRPGDLLGALTKDAGLDGNDIGKIDIFDFHTLVGIDRAVAKRALSYLETGKVKGRSVKARRVS